MIFFYSFLAVGVVYFIGLLIYTFVNMPNLNKFIEGWLERTLWIWLPFYSFRRLILEIILKKK